jgi:hypothetical protein
MDTTLVTTVIAAGAGLIGAVIGGTVTAVSSAYNLNAGFRQQRTLEEQRYQQRLDFEASERSVRATALRRSITRLTAWLRNTSSLSPTSRINLESWDHAIKALRKVIETPEADLLLSDSENKAIWNATEDGAFTVKLMQQGAAFATNGLRLNRSIAEQAFTLCFTALRDAHHALADEEGVAAIDRMLKRGFEGCGMFLSDNDVFYPIPADGKSFIVKLMPLITDPANPTARDSR